jgi:hypothetical protein
VDGEYLRHGMFDLPDDFFSGGARFYHSRGLSLRLKYTRQPRGLAPVSDPR